MINSITGRPIALQTWNRYVAYVHRVKVLRGWQKNCYALIPLNHIDQRFELVETVYFEVYRSHSDGEDVRMPLLHYINNTLNIIYQTDCDYQKMHEDVATQYDMVLPWSTNLKKDHLVYWKDYFESYEVSGFRDHNIVIDSPFENEINIPGWVELTYVKEKKGKSIYRLKDMHALEK